MAANSTADARVRDDQLIVTRDCVAGADTRPAAERCAAGSISGLRSRRRRSEAS